MNQRAEPVPDRSITSPEADQPLVYEASEYQAGVCNIGAAEVARRRRTGHVGLLATLAVLGTLVYVDAPTPARMLVALPAWTAASGYLQARLRFCANYGARGLVNFGPAGSTRRVADPEARARDRAMAVRISAAGFAIGVAVGFVAVLLPI